MNILIFTGVGPISSFSFFQPESFKPDEKKIFNKFGDPAYKEEGLDYFDQTDGLQAPYSDDDSELADENKKRGDDQPQDPTRRKSQYEYQTIDYYETRDDLRAPFDKNNLYKVKDTEDNEVE